MALEKLPEFQDDLELLILKHHGLNGLEWTASPRIFVFFFYINLLAYSCFSPKIFESGFRMKVMRPCAQKEGRLIEALDKGICSYKKIILKLFFGQVACRILVSPSGLNPYPFQWEAWSLNHTGPQEVPRREFKKASD